MLCIKLLFRLFVVVFVFLLCTVLLLLVRTETTMLENILVAV